MEEEREKRRLEEEELRAAEEEEEEEQREEERNTASRAASGAGGGGGGGMGSLSEQGRGDAYNVVCQPCNVLGPCYALSGTCSRRCLVLNAYWAGYTSRGGAVLTRIGSLMVCSTDIHVTLNSA